MNKLILLIASAITVMIVVLSLGASLAPPALANIPAGSSSVGLKTDRLPAMKQTVTASGEEAEWVLDCLDQFGPDAGEPDRRALSACLPS